MIDEETLKKEEDSMKRMIARLLCLVLTMSVLCPVSGCGTAAQGTDLMQDIVPGDSEGDTAADRTEHVDVDVDLDENRAVAVTDFAVRLFRQSAEEGKNTLISPLSVLCALAMTANGAEGNTLSQMETVLGLPLEELNAYLHAYTEALPEGEKYQLKAANAVWFKDDGQFTVEQDFLRTNAEYYGAGIYKAPFDDTTLKGINDWVSDNTDGMIKNILDRIPEDAVMYLVNALSFDAEWQDTYEAYQIRDDVFTGEDKATREIKLMYSEEYQYLQDDNACGFIKPYADGKYAFAALLPEEGVTVADYVAALDGERLAEILNNVQDTTVHAAIPRFQAEYSMEMSEILKAMGMTDAFDGDAADFAGIGHSETGNLFISRVLHKTYIAVDELGTKAGAATAVEMSESALMEEPKEVYLNRPFVYLIIDCEERLPVFMGTVMEVE